MCNLREKRKYTIVVPVAVKGKYQKKRKNQKREADVKQYYVKYFKV